MAVCNVCCRSVSLTGTGLVWVHGPRHLHCLGSGKPPKTSDSPSGPPPMVVGPEPPRVPSSTRAIDLLPAACEPEILQSVLLIKVINRIPSAARHQCSVKFTAILDEVVTVNSVAAWDRLLRFTSRCLRVPSDVNRSRSLSAKIKDQLAHEESPLPQRSRKPKKDSHLFPPSPTPPRLAYLSGCQRK